MANIEKILSTDITSTLFEARENELSNIEIEEKEFFYNLNEKYSINYEELKSVLSKLEDKDVDRLKKIFDNYVSRQNLIVEKENEKFYKARV